PRGVRFIAVYPNARESDAEVRQSAANRGYAFPVARDTNAAVARTWGVGVTPEAVILDAQGRVVYKGPLDDDPGIGQAKTPLLTNALDAVLDGRAPSKLEVTAIGCTIER